MITDKLASYGAAKRGDPYAGFPSAVRLEPLPASPAVEPRQHKGLNNRAENSHHPPPAFQRRRRWNLRWLRPRDGESGR